MGAGIFPRDILVVDRALTPHAGDVVVAQVDGDFTVKRFYREQGAILLKPENPAYAVIVIRPEQQFEIFGVVRWVIHNPNRRSS